MAPALFLFDFEVRLERFADLTVVDFPDLAQGFKTYDEFTRKMKVYGLI